MLDRIPLGRIGRIVRRPDFNPDFVGQSLQGLFENMMVAGIAAAAIQQNQQRCRANVAVATHLLPPEFDRITRKFRSVRTGTDIDHRIIALNVIDAVRDQVALRQMRVIMIVDGLRLKTIYLPITVEITQLLFLLGVNADHRVARPFILGFQSSDLPELPVSFLELTRWLGLDHLALHVTVLFEQFSDDIAAYPESSFFSALEIS